MKGEYEMIIAEKEKSNSVKFQGNVNGSDYRYRVFK